MLKQILAKLRLRRRDHTEPASLNGAYSIEKSGVTLTPNLRALRLAMTVSDQLLSMGVPAIDVVAKAHDIIDTYCDQPVHINISFDLITLSQVRGIEYEPLTLVRPVVMREINNMTVQSIQQLIQEIHQGKMTLSQAEEALDKILSEPIKYPKWLPLSANAAIAPAVVLLFSTDWRAILISYIIALLVDRLLLTMVRRSIPPFFRQIAAGIFVTLAAAIIAWSPRFGVPFLGDINPTLIVVGGIIMLVAGLAIVGAVQDAVEEYYLTATARLLKVFMLTAGIVIGILIGIYTARKLGIGIAVSPDPLHLTDIQFQLIGGAGIAAAYALSTQTRLRAVVWAALIGAGAVGVIYIARSLDISIVPATGIAATFVGLMAALFSRLWQTPGSGIIAAGIIPLVPGLALYTGLMQLVNYPPGDPLFFRGAGTLFTVVGTALAIGAGASFGNMLGRPLHRRITMARNLGPVSDFMHWQLRAARKPNQLARWVLQLRGRPPDKP